VVIIAAHAFISVRLLTLKDLLVLLLLLLLLRLLLGIIPFAVTAFLLRVLPLRVLLLRVLLLRVLLLRVLEIRPLRHVGVALRADPVDVEEQLVTLQRFLNGAVVLRPRERYVRMREDGDVAKPLDPRVVLPNLQRHRPDERIRRGLHQTRHAQRRLHRLRPDEHLVLFLRVERGTLTRRGSLLHSPPLKRVARLVEELELFDGPLPKVVLRRLEAVEEHDFAQLALGKRPEHHRRFRGGPPLEVQQQRRWDLGRGRTRARRRGGLPQLVELGRDAVVLAQRLEIRSLALEVVQRLLDDLVDVVVLGAQARQRQGCRPLILLHLLLILDRILALAVFPIFNLLVFSLERDGAPETWTPLDEGVVLLVLPTVDDAWVIRLLEPPLARGVEPHELIAAVLAHLVQLEHALHRRVWQVLQSLRRDRRADVEERRAVDSRRVRRVRVELVHRDAARKQVLEHVEDAARLHLNLERVILSRAHKHVDERGFTRCRRWLPASCWTLEADPAQDVEGFERSGVRR